MVDKYSAADMQNAGRLKQMRMVAGLVNQQNRKALPITFGSALGILLVLTLVAVFTGQWYLIAFGVLLGAMAGVILFGRFAQAAQYSAIAGQPGAAAAVLQSMRGNWTVTPAVNANRNMDVVHRAVGRAGVVLVGEGMPSRVAGLLANEKRKIFKLPRALKPAAVSDLNYRLKALQPSMQMPKGPLPKNVRQPKMPRPR